MFRVYSGPRGSERISALDKERMLYKEFDSLDGALAWARALGEFGATITFAGNFPGTTQTMPLARYVE